jgi:hypothetical protein
MLTFMFCIAGGFYLDSRNIPDALAFIPKPSFVTYSYPVGGGKHVCLVSFALKLACAF